MARFNTRAAKARPVNRRSARRGGSCGPTRATGAASATRARSCSCWRCPTSSRTPSTRAPSSATPRFTRLVRDLAVSDPGGRPALLGWLRGEGATCARPPSSAPPSTCTHGWPPTRPTARRTGRSWPLCCSAPTSPASCSRTGRRRTAAPSPSPSSAASPTPYDGCTTSGRCSSTTPRPRATRFGDVLQPGARRAGPGQALAGRPVPSTRSTGATTRTPPCRPRPFPRSPCTAS